MKPNKPGIWYSRDGSRNPVVVWDMGCGLRFSALNAENGTFQIMTPTGHHIDHIVPDDWLPAEPPKFPELPPKQPMVYARGDYHEPDWWMIRPGKFAVTFDDRSKSGYTALFTDLTVIPHPDNDPEAVRLIEEAKK